MKIFERFVRTLYWLQVFAAPVVLFGLISLLVYSKRRKHGLEKFFANLYGSTEIKDRPKQPPCRHFSDDIFLQAVRRYSGI